MKCSGHTVVENDAAGEAAGPGQRRIDVGNLPNELKKQKLGPGKIQGATVVLRGIDTSRIAEADGVDSGLEPADTITSLRIGGNRDDQILLK